MVKQEPIKEPEMFKVMDKILSFLSFIVYVILIIIILGCSIGTISLLYLHGFIKYSFLLDNILTTLFIFTILTVVIDLYFRMLKYFTRKREPIIKAIREKAKQELKKEIIAELKNANRR